MSLVEILFTYRDMIRGHGRGYADSWLNMSCLPEIAQEVKNSLTDKGDFIGADQSVIVATWRYVPKD